MKDQILKIAKVKSEKEFYKKYPSEEAFMKAHGKAFKKAAMGSQMVNDQLHQLTDWSNPPIAQDGTWLSGVPGLGTSQATVDPSTGMVNSAKGFVTKADTDALGLSGGASTAKGFDAGGAGMAGLQGIGKIIGGIEAINAQRKAQKKAEQANQLSGLALQAQQTTQQPKRNYVRPEDNLVQPGQMGNPYGSGTNFLAQNGTMIGGNPTEIQNMYNPGDMYTDLGFEPMGETLKQYRHGGGLPKAEFGEYFQDSGQAQIGSAVGGAIAQGFGLPPQVGELVGKVAGNLLGGAKDARKLQAQKDQTALQQSQLAFNQNNSLGAYRKNGGPIDSEHKWVSNSWQPQTFTKFGEYSAKQLLAPPKDADMLRSGGHLSEDYVEPSAEAMFTGRPDMPHAQFGLIMGPINKGMIDTVQNSEKANKLKQAIASGMMEGGGRMTSTNMMFDTDKYPRAEGGVQLAMGGDLKVGEGGYAETLSYNPNLPGGEIGMFRGASHDNGGIQTQYGDNGVEVEGGEPVVKLQDGGSTENLVVFGNIKINKNIADLMGDPKAKDKKFKTYIADVAKNDAKQLKRINKGLQMIQDSDENSAFDHLKLNTGKAILEGATAWQKINAEKIKQAGIVQDAIHKTANELGAKSDKLAEGKIEKETDPRMVAQDGKKMKKYEVPNFLKIPRTTIPYDPQQPEYQSRQTLSYPTAPQTFSGSPAFEESEAISTEPGFGSKAWDITKKIGKAVGKGVDKYGPTVLSNVEPWLRPSNANEDLPPDQLYPEYFALATNQLEPVQAQTYQPMLDTPYDISLNDQLNAIDSQSRAAIRAAGSNPAAQAMIMAQSLEAKNKVLGEQTRINQANKMQVYDKNRALLNDAQLKNLQILDQQYVRQAQAKSNTKTQTQAALNSIAAKTAQQRATNRKLAVMENMYGFRFSPSGRAYNVNSPAQFNLQGTGQGSSRGLAPGYGYTYDEQGQIIGTRKVPNSTKPSLSELDDVFQKNGGKTSKKNARNSSIVKALKNL